MDWIYLALFWTPKALHIESIIHPRTGDDKLRNDFKGHTGAA